LGYLDKIWDILKKIVPEFNWTDESTPHTGTKPKETKVSEIKNEISPVNKQPDKPEKAEKSDKEKAEQKEIGKKKNRDGEKEKSKSALHPSEASTEVQPSSQSLAESSSMPTQPEMAVCAGCIPLHLSEEKFFSLTQMTDSSEKLRQYGLSHVYSHPVLVTRIRSCALEAPEKPIAPWKLFRQKKTVAKSEPQEPVLEKPEQYIEIASLFLNYKFNPIEIPNNIFFTQSTIQKGLHSMTRLPSVTESDENIDDSNVEMNQSGRCSSAEDYSQFTFLTPNLIISSFTNKYQHDVKSATSLKSDYYNYCIPLSKTAKQEGSSIPKALLKVEHFSWKCLTPGELVLKMHTYATKATVLNLPVGRHVLLFTVSSSIGHHIHLCSMVPFVFGEEDAVMRNLEKVFNSAFWFLIKYVLDKKIPHRYKFAFRSFTLDFKYSDVFEDDSVSSGTKENANVKEILQKLWAAVELNFEQCAVVLLREMFKRNCNSVKMFPCYEDEWYKISFTDYAVTYSDQPPNIWFVVFREIFFVPEDMFLVPRMYTTIPSCRLHVIDNDTLEEMPHVFLKMAPHIYPKNKKGYTFMAEARTGDKALAAGRWRLRLISSRSPLPFLSREAVNNIYSTKEIKEYYIPNDKCVMFRYSVKVTASHIATVQVQTSNSDVFIKLQVLDNEEEIVNVTGKGHAVIPAFNFLSNETLLCSFSSKSQVVRGVGKKESETRFKRRGRVSAPKDTRSSFKRGLSQESLSVLEEAAFPSENLESNQESPQQHVHILHFLSQPHRYIIQALVLHNSWPLTETQILFVQSLKEIEKAELKGMSPQQDAINKPYWTLRLVSEQREMENLELKRDTQRADEIKAMKRAWESAEPGRAVKAFQERMKFINKYVERDSKEPIAGMDTASSSSKSEERDSFSHTTEMTASQTAIDSSLPTQQKKWEPVDLSPYMRKTTSESVLRNESIIQEQEKWKMEKVNNFRQLRGLALEQREMEQHARTLLKQNMLDMYENLQASLDEKRGRVHSIREAYRSKLLKAELGKLEELAAHEVMLQTEQEKKSQDAHKKKQGKGLGKRM
ncbi:UNVERIFIED_CONTAM: hypothetical protein H355_010722, partial [Colinus virginianus]